MKLTPDILSHQWCFASEPKDQADEGNPVNVGQKSFLIYAVG